MTTITNARRAGAALLVAVCAAGALSAQAQNTSPRAAARTAGTANVAAPPAYVIGPEDVLDIQFWREKEISGEVVVRPDGKITTPLLNDIQAAGLTPDQLRARLNEEAAKYLEAPSATVIVKQINSRKAFITGEVEKPGPYPVVAATTVLQLIALAGGLKEYADRGSIVVLRTENGRQTRLPFDYDKVIAGKALYQNVELRPGDTVVVR
jgi:polysaccharide biosynthesis/export protein